MAFLPLDLGVVSIDGQEYPLVWFEVRVDPTAANDAPDKVVIEAEFYDRGTVRSVTIRIPDLSLPGPITSRP